MPFSPAHCVQRIRLLSLTEDLAELVVVLPPSATLALADGLETGRVRLTTSSFGFARLRGVNDDHAARIAGTFQRIVRSSSGVPGDIGENAVATALRVANHLRSVERLARPELEIAWTGPPAAGPLVRSTSVVLEEMLERVRDAGEVLLVGYAVTVEAGSVMERVVELLVSAARRRANLSIVLHSDEDETTNLDNLLALWDVFVKKPKVYTWRPPPEHPYTKLHAKCLVVDRLDALVTSANFTFHGLESNLELGLRVRGPQAGAIAERFDHLIASKVLQPWAKT